MTRDEIKVMFAALSRVYPPNLMPAIDADTINVWTDLLQDVDGQMALMATKAWAQTNKYPPTVADIREKLVRSELERGDTAEQAWTKVYRAIVRYGHTDRDGAESFLGDLWQMVGGDWGYYCSLQEDQIPNEKARFIRAYTARQVRTKESLQIAAPVRAALDSGKLRLEAANGAG